MADNGFYADGCNVLLCYIIVRSRGRLNWISNLIKHPTLATQPTSQAIRVWRVKYGWRPAGRFSRKLIRVLVIISHDPMSVVTRHTSHNQRGSRYPGSQEITMVSGGHPDNMTDRSLVWCLSGNVTNDKLRITRMRGYTAPTHSMWPVSTEQPGWADNGCFQQTGAHCPETPSRHLGTVEPFHPAWSGPYIMIFYSAGKLMMRLYLETFQHYKAWDVDSLGLDSAPWQHRHSEVTSRPGDKLSPHPL